MLKTVVKLGLFYFCFKYYKYKFLSSIKKIGDKKLYIFDLDNTIANTWISFNKKHKNDTNRLKSLSIFIGMKKFINKLDKNKSFIIVLTARDYWHYETTKVWIKSNGLAVDELILVDKPSQKIYLLKNIDERVHYYDDMSYNHENGRIKFYKNEIMNIRQLPNVKYFGYNEIEKINKAAKNETITNNI